MKDFNLYLQADALVILLPSHNSPAPLPNLISFISEQGVQFSYDVAEMTFNLMTGIL